MKRIIKIALLIFVAASAAYLVANELGWHEHGFENIGSTNGSQIIDENDEIKGSAVVVFYFHTSRRCFTCKAIESSIKEVLDTNFKLELDDGKILWRPVNLDKPENRHFINDFSLSNPTAVIAKIDDGKIGSHKELDLLWKIVRNKPVLNEYIKSETSAFLKMEKN
jgi:hypothetical protein